MHRVMIHPANYDNIHLAVDQAFALFPMDLAGKKVLVKPNVLRAAEAREGITTHPALLSAVIEKVASATPAELWVGDNPGLFNYGANEEGFEKTGLMAAARDYYRNIGLDPVKVEFNPDFMPTVGLSREVLEADVIISLPKFKTHGLTVMTGAIKNSYGFLPGAQKSRLHKAAGSPERFHEMIVDVFRLRVPDLFIVDAVVGMEGNGPASPDLRDIGLVLAADNAVALDAVMARMMGLDPGKLRFLQKAKEMALGDFAPDRIDVIGELKPIPDFQIPSLGGEAIHGNQMIQDVLQEKTLLRPQADRDLCTGCETCVEQCPVSALSMVDEFPEVDPDICITCFCCQEVCPEKAIQLK